MDHDKSSLLRDAGAASTSSENRTYHSVQSHVEAPEIIIAKARRLPQYLAALTATLSALSAGVVLGWTSPIEVAIESGKFHNITVDSNQMGWIGSFVPLGAMIMCIPTGFVCDLIGRKKTLLLLVVPFTLGWILIICAKNVAMLYCGRFITGLASGATCVAAPLYVGEIAMKDIRGTLGSYFQLMVTIGVFLAYFFGKFLTPVNYTIVCGSMPLLFFVAFLLQPETPFYCLSKNRYDEAMSALFKLRGGDYDIQAELSEIEGALKESLESSVSYKESFKRKAIYKAFIIALMLMFFQQFSGINAVILYTSNIFKSSGVKLDANTASIIVGAAQAIATFISSLVIDKLGRRILLIISTLVMALSSLILATFFLLKDRIKIDETSLEKFGFIPVLALCVFVIVFSLGLGPIPWLISSEIFSSDVKSLAGSAAGTFNWFLAFLVTRFYLQVCQAVGQDVTFYVFAAISVIGGGFVWRVVPETKGKSVEQVQSELEG